MPEEIGGVLKQIRRLLGMAKIASFSLLFVEWRRRFNGFTLVFLQTRL
jgi:hypothetical protein